VLSKCANPKCSARMKYMNDGSVYVVPKASMGKYWTGDEGEFSAPPGKQIECFWLCNVCSRQMTISKHGELECRNITTRSWEVRVDTGRAMQQKPAHASVGVSILLPDWGAGIPVSDSTSSAVN